MNYAIVFAGGVGRRMNNGALPKQFLELNNKPIIIYTLEQFEMNNNVDGIIVVCVSGWKEYLRKKIDLFGLKKVKKILTGGSSALESQFVGVRYIKENLVVNGKDTYVLLHDGVRPLVDQETINSNIKDVKIYGSAITVVPAIETIAISSTNSKISKLLNRDDCLMARAPQSYRLDKLWRTYLEAKNDENLSFIDSATMMQTYGCELHTVLGKTNNIKVTTPVDFYIFKAIMDARMNEQVFGG
ncbi:MULTISPECIES: 2-C-methyl-D-erythritol 4-phosphate cytidylyltransferase [Lactobacillaceae]|uniref:IspD/TarI family cytidylyltransferase n=1 Tax=Lactobacillaceae TaxID=33958 RepID=UPI0014564A87|nr:IspD/TarI family cytidylyltransferase [Lactobacillus sp. HBUAS51381]NLR09052.1 2-C-methyl-D-erythritol 4-phosphate cytidylyltransferase [Lactobacillus sp. HBUAS51381]